MQMWRDLTMLQGQDERVLAVGGVGHGVAVARQVMGEQAQGDRVVEPGVLGSRVRTAEFRAVRGRYADERGWADF